MNNRRVPRDQHDLSESERAFLEHHDPEEHSRRLRAELTNIRSNLDRLEGGFNQWSEELENLRAYLEESNQERDQARREVQEIQNRENTPRLLPFPIDSWVRVTNNHRGFQGTIGRVIGTPSFVRATVRGYYGPGANITFDRGTSNLELTQEPRISLDSSLPTNRSNRNSRRQSNLSS